MKATAYLVAGFICITGGLALAQQKEEIVSKEGNIVVIRITGIGMDKDLAELDAKRKAVEKGAGANIYSKSEVKDFELVKDTILARAAGFIKSTKVLSAKEMEDETWEVRIEAEVSIQGIEDTWGTVTEALKQHGRPKIMVFINEKMGQQVVETSTVQTKIEDLLLKSGFLLVNRDQIKEIDRKDLASAVAEDNPDKALAVAKRFGAQIFISGSANAEEGVEKRIGGVHMFTAEGEANIRVFRSDTGQLMSSTAGVPTRGVQQVARSACKQALDAQAQQVAPKITLEVLTFWQDAVSGRGELKLEITGVTFKQYSALKKALKEIKQIKDINAEFRNNTVEASIQSDTGAEKLAEIISEAMDNLEIEDVSANVIKAKLTGN